MAELIEREFKGLQIGQRREDGYLNATKLAKAYEVETGKRKDVHNWLETERAKEYMEYLSDDTGVPVSQMTETRKGGRGLQGTWIHPKLAIPFSMWLSVEFEFQVSKWIEDWLSAGKAKQVESDRQKWLLEVMPSRSLPWHKVFSDEFWIELERLYLLKQSNPRCSQWINTHVYRYFASDVRERLDDVNPLYGRFRPHKQHQHMDGDLKDQLVEHLKTVVCLMKAANSSQEFEGLMNARFCRQYQLNLDLAA